MYHAQPADATLIAQPSAYSASTASLSFGSISMFVMISSIRDSSARISAKMFCSAVKCVIFPSSYCCQYPDFKMSGNALQTKS